MLLVTGATGFIGQHLMDIVPDARAVIRRPSNRLFANSFAIDSLDESTQWEGAFDGVDSIIHLAGIAHSHNFNKVDYFRVNVEGTINLAKQAANAGVKRFVFVSTIGVLGNGTSSMPYHSGSQAQPHSEYAESKYLAEELLVKLSKSTDLEIVIVRPTLVYGPNAPGNFGALRELVKVLPVLPFKLIANKRDFIAVQNLVDLLLCCASHPCAPGNIFLASDGETVSIKDFTDIIASSVNKRSIQVPVPLFLFRLVAKLTGKSKLIEQLVGNLEVDSSETKRVLGWVAPYTMTEALSSERR